MLDNRSDIRGTTSYAANALKGQPQYWVDEVNAARRAKGLSAVHVTGRGWDQLTDSEKRNIESAQTEKRIQAAKDDARLIELQNELARLKELVSRES